MLEQFSCNLDSSTRNRNCRWSSLFIHTKTSYKGQPLPFLPISQIRTPSVHRCFLMVDQIISLSLSLSLTTRLRANYTGERKRRDGREDERLRRTAKTRYQATHVTVSIAHYLRSIEQTATLLPLVSRLHAHRPPPPRAWTRRTCRPVLLSRLCSETMNKRREERSPARSTFLNRKRCINIIVLSLLPA